MVKHIAKVMGLYMLSMLVLSYAANEGVTGKWVNCIAFGVFSLAATVEVFMTINHYRKIKKEENAEGADS